jgi:hypothetical protein
VDEAGRVGERLARVSILLDVDAHGRVVPNDEAARRELADRAGRFALLPSAPDLLVARRTPPAGGARPPPRCILAGDASAFPLADFIAFVHQSRLSGVLTVSAAGAERSIAFKDGEVRGARSDAVGERLADVVLRLGYAAKERLAEADAERALGKDLVERGLIAETDLWKCLHEQVAVVFHAILLSREGVFAMVDDPGAELGTPLSVNTQSLLMDGIRRIDELTLFRARIPGPHAHLRRREPRLAAPLHPPEQELLALVDGRRTVAEVAQAAHRSEFDATKLLYHLAEAGHVEAVSEATASRAASPEDRLAAIAAGLNGILREIAKAVAAAGALDGFLASVRAYLADPSSPYAPLWTLVVPGPDGALEDGAVLGNLSALKGAALKKVEPSGDAGRFLYDGMRELMFFYLFLAGERLPRDADERLAREVKRRADALGELR